MNVDWLTLSQYSGETGSTTITGAVTDNLNIGINRYATVRFSNSEGLYADLNITQTAFTEGLTFSVTPYLLQFQTSGETLTGTVFSNSKWFVVDYPSWISIVSDNPDMTGAGNLFFTATPNTGDTERAGNIRITSYGEERLIYAIQPAYSSLSVNPKEIRLVGQTGATATTSFTVTSSANWEITDYDSEYLEINRLSGESGTTTVQVTLKNVPEMFILANIPFQKTITLTDHITTEEVNIVLVGDDDKNDKYVYVTYYLPSAGNFKAVQINSCGGCPVWNYEVMDNYTIRSTDGSHIEEIGNTCFAFADFYFYTSTPGYHTIRYYSEYYSIPFAAFKDNPYVYSVVIGDQNNGEIQNYALYNSSTQKLVLGLGRHIMQQPNLYTFCNIRLGDYFYWPDSTYFYSASAFNGSSTGTLVLQSPKELHNYISYNDLIILNI